MSGLRQHDAVSVCGGLTPALCACMLQAAAKEDAEKQAARLQATSAQLRAEKEAQQRQVEALQQQLARRDAVVSGAGQLTRVGHERIAVRMVIDALQWAPLQQTQRRTHVLC